MYLKYFNIRTCFLNSEVMWLIASRPTVFHQPSDIGASWPCIGHEQSTMATRVSMVSHSKPKKPWHRLCITGGQDNGTWNRWKSVLWYHHGLIRLVASANIWLEIHSVVETKGWDMSRSVPNNTTAELSCCPSPVPRLPGASIMLLPDPPSCQSRNPKVKKQKAWWPFQLLSGSTGLKIIPKRL